MSLITLITDISLPTTINKFGVYMANVINANPGIWTAEEVVSVWNNFQDSRDRKYNKRKLTSKSDRKVAREKRRSERKRVLTDLITDIAEEDDIPAEINSDDEDVVISFKNPISESKPPERPKSPKKSSDKKKVKSSDKKNTKSSPKKSSDKKKAAAEGCVYTFVKGKTKGETCGCEISDESTTHSYCKKHLKQEA